MSLILRGQPLDRLFAVMEAAEWVFKPTVFGLSVALYFDTKTAIRYIQCNNGPIGLKALLTAQPPLQQRPIPFFLNVNFTVKYFKLDININKHFDSFYTEAK